MAAIQISRYEAEEDDLPDVCMLCGSPATERKRRRFTWHPLWVYLLLPFGWLPYVIVAAILTERARCYTHFCARHKNHWRIRTLAIWGFFVGLMAIIFGVLPLVAWMDIQLSPSTKNVVGGFVCIGAPALVLIWLASIPIIQVTAIHLGEVTKNRLTLKGVSPAFVDAVNDYRNKREVEEEQGEYRRQFRPRGSPGPEKGIYDPEQ